MPIARIDSAIDNPACTAQVMNSFCGSESTDEPEDDNTPATTIEPSVNRSMAVSPIGEDERQCDAQSVPNMRKTGTGLA